ncbi:MAG: hybrid sensor histidine kinase/response regulator [Candidatus Aminicenantes bacterium]|nr:hybrid sensor histidine kinase/response regulator [Candidatus Aminicenantes bacterium]MDH5705921.1 hybrid sensor histidine kinase/response regulator [Candidatus Aminicenantes bacterium]
MLGKKPVVLVIDDEEIMRDSCTQILTKDGFQAETAENGTIGLEKIKEIKPDLVLVDLKMPGISGMEVLEKIKEIDPNIISVVITGYATVESAVDAMKIGAYDFLPKPFSPDQLRLIIRRGLERRKLILETESLRQEKKLMEENFITMVSHQLRSPLVTIIQYYEVILGGMAGDVPEKQKEIIQKTKARLEGLLNLITDWLDVARLDSGQIVESLQPTPVKKIVTKVIEDLKPLTQEENISLELGSCSKNDVVQGNADTLEQVFSNLATNAIRYNRPNGKVIVSIKENADYIAVEVRDTGIGIAKEHLPFIFDQFFRVKRGEGQKVKGTGLGLSIAKKIVDAHGGSIQVTSEPDKGSTFTVLLPKAEKKGR